MKNKISAAAWSASITMIVIVAVILVAEYVASFKSFLASLTGHHWVTKSVLEVILFVAPFPGARDGYEEGTRKSR